jgi:protein TonB
MRADVEEPSIPERYRAPLAALWVSIGLHAALIALVQVAPPPSGTAQTVIEARLTSTAKPAPVAMTANAPRPEAVAVQPQAAPEPPPPAQTEATPETAPQAGAGRASPVEPEATSPRMEMPVAVDLTYYTAREVDVHPQALFPIEPAYPPQAEAARASGSVRLALKVEENGEVSHAEVIASDPPGLFDASALAAFGKARFAPAQKNGRPVRALVVIEVKYDYAGRLAPRGEEGKVTGQ